MKHVQKMTWELRTIDIQILRQIRNEDSAVTVFIIDVFFKKRRHFSKPQMNEEGMDYSK